MPGTRELTRRIKSVKSTRKITRAMQLISAAKMRKSQTATLASRTYTKLAWELIQSLGSQAAIESPLTRAFPEAKKVGIVIISSNRGQVGGFNNNLFKKIRQFEEAEPELIEEVVVLGKKARENALRLKRTVLAEFDKLDTTIPVEQIYPLVTLLTNAYKSGKYNKILIVYNHFASTLVQVPTIKTLLPFSTDAVAATETTAAAASEVVFEPSPKEVAEHLLPRILESQIYQAILESDASEHSARMVMMKNATESAGDLIDDLTLTFNSLRQSKITTELSEITAGRIALEK
jgi:F-type H+-transporting ATPase subunit gamma